MVNVIEIKEMLKGKDYDFLRNDANLGNNIMFLTLGGSKAYGTDVETSDTDIRGCTMMQKSMLLGLPSYSKNNFEQYVETETDTVIYAFNKLVELLLSCNPNTIEMLGCKPEHYIYKNEVGDMLISNKSLFLSQRAITAFGGYATAQLRRLTNALARDAYTQSEKEKHIYNSCMNILNTFDDRHAEMKEGSINLYVDKSQKEEMDTEIFTDITLKHYPLRDMQGIFSELFNVIRDYQKIGKRNHKKDDEHLNKHAMHLIRLYLMGIDILEKGEIKTYREENLDLLMSIRRGDFRTSDGLFNSAFFDMITEYEKRLNYAAENTCLPKQPDYKRVNELVMTINEMAIKKSM